MPLNTQVLRDGESPQLNWSDFHVAAMVIAASADSGRGPYADMDSFVAEAKELMERQGCIAVSPNDAFNLAAYHTLAATPLNEGEYTMENLELKFVDKTDGEEFILKPGDVLRAWRS